MARRRWRRRLARSAVLGVLSSVVFSLAAGVLGGNARVRPSATVAWRSRADFLTNTDYTVHVPAESDPGDPIDETARRHLALARSDRYLEPGAPAPDFAGGGADPVRSVRWIRITTFGVPFESFWGYTASDGLQRTGGTPTMVRRGDWLGLLAPSRAGSGARIFAYWPLGSGLAANALVHGAGWFGAFSLLRTLVVAVRRRRGRCTACGYSRRGLAPGGACPECGTGPRLER